MEKCKAKTGKGTRCARNATMGDYCAAHARNTPHGDYGHPGMDEKEQPKPSEMTAIDRARAEIMAGRTLTLDEVRKRADLPGVPAKKRTIKDRFNDWKKRR